LSKYFKIASFFEKQLIILPPTLLIFPNFESFDLSAIPPSKITSFIKFYAPRASNSSKQDRTTYVPKEKERILMQQLGKRLPAKINLAKYFPQLTASLKAFSNGLSMLK